MRNISFAMTTWQVRLGCKDITRRFAWWDLKPGELLGPIKKGQGLKKGEKVKHIRGPIKILDTRPEPLNAITPEDVLREGFIDWTPEQYVDMMVKTHRCPPDKEVNRIVFTYTDEVDDGMHYTPKQASRHAVAFCEKHPGWQRVCDIEDPDSLYLTYDELPTPVKRDWSERYGKEGGPKMWEEFGNKPIRVPYGYISGEGHFYSNFRHVPRYHNIMLIFKTS